MLYMACFSHTGCTSEAAAKPFWSWSETDGQKWGCRLRNRDASNVSIYIYIYKTPQNGNYSPHLWHDKPIYKHKDNNWNLWYFGPQLPHQKSVMKAQKMEIHRNSARPCSAKWQRATDDLSACESECLPPFRDLRKIRGSNLVVWWIYPIFTWFL